MQLKNMHNKKDNKKLFIEKRSKKRTTEFLTDKFLNNGKIEVNGKVFEVFEITNYTSLDFSLTIDVDFNEFIKNKEYSISYTNMNKSIFNGFWICIGKRKDNSKYIFNFSRKNNEYLNFYSEVLDKKLFLNCSNFRVFSLFDTIDSKNVSLLFSEMKDFPGEIPVIIRSEDATVLLNGSVSFSAQAKEISHFDINIISKNDLFEKETNYIIEFNFLATRYLFLSNKLHDDLDFEIVSTEIPDKILAITGRHFDRYPSNKHANLFYNKDNFKCLIVNISSQGCKIDLINHESITLGEVVKLNINNSEIECKVVSKYNNSIHLYFDNLNNYNSLISFFITAVGNEYIFRNSSNYEKFLNLYIDVGYGPENIEEIDSWKNETISTWKILDELLPGNCIGYENDISKKIESSIGVLPISNKAVYGHSGCMLKTLDSSMGFFRDYTYSMSYVSFLPNVEYFIGSYNNKSKFTTRLQVSFDLTSIPLRNNIIKTRKIKFTQNEIKKTKLIKIIQEKPENLSFLKESIQEFLKLMISTNPILKELHETTHFCVYNIKNEKIGWIVKSKAIKYITARNIFSYSWIFLDRETENTTEILDTLSQELDLLNSNAYLVIGDGSIQYSETSKFGSDGSFWVTSHFDDFGPIISSVALAIYHILKKYGSEAGKNVIQLL